MATSYDVRVYRTDKYVGSRVTTHRVRWSVAGRRHKKGFRTAAAAESFRSELLVAARQGEPFDVDTGLPASKVRLLAVNLTWYEFACQYVDMKWPGISAKYRKGIAEALTTLTMSMLISAGRDASEEKAIRSALTNWGFNIRRGSEDQPEAVTEALRYVAQKSRLLTDLAQPAVLRKVLDAAATRLDGKPAAGRTAHYKRVVLSNCLSYAVELGHLESNPVSTIRWKAPKTSRGIDRRVVANHEQAKALLDAVRDTPLSGPALVAFFGALYYSALRPEEAVEVRRSNLDLPNEGFGWITLEGAAPQLERHWTDSGTRREGRVLKHRAVGDVRRVPCPPELVALLKAHLQEFGTDDDGRIFRGIKGGPLSGDTYVTIWRKAREKALTPEQARSPLARRPYDLRHAAVSTWLNAGVPAAQVAEWAGHSIAVLHSIYAKCIDGHEALALERVQVALGISSA